MFNDVRVRKQLFSEGFSFNMQILTKKHCLWEEKSVKNLNTTVMHFNSLSIYTKLMTWRYDLRVI